MHAKDCAVTICGGPRVTRWTFYHTLTLAPDRITSVWARVWPCRNTNAATYRTKFVAANGISADDETGHRYVECVSGNELTRSQPARVCLCSQKLNTIIKKV